MGDVSEKVKSLAWLVQIKQESGRVRNQLTRNASVLNTHKDKMQVVALGTQPAKVELPLCEEIYDDTDLTPLSRSRNTYLSATTPAPFHKSDSEKLVNLVRDEGRLAAGVGAAILSTEEIDERVDHRDVDWLKISEGFDMRRSPIECLIRWQNIDNPRLDNTTLTADGLARLRGCYERRLHNKDTQDTQDTLDTYSFWSGVSKDFSTAKSPRSPHFCMKQIGMHLASHIQDNTKKKKGGKRRR